MMKTIWLSRTTYTLQFFCNHNLFQIFAILSYLELGIFAIPSVLEEFPNEETISAFGIEPRLTGAKRARLARFICSVQHGALINSISKAW